MAKQTLSSAETRANEAEEILDAIKDGKVEMIKIYEDGSVLYDPSAFKKYLESRIRKYRVKV